MKSESEVQQLIQLEAPKLGCIPLRNNSGAFKDSTGRMIFFGLGNISKAMNENFKSSDLICITQLTIQPHHLGKQVAVFTAIECKMQGWVYSGNAREKAQKNFINWVISLGGFAGFASDVDEFKGIIGK